MRSFLMLMLMGECGESGSDLWADAVGVDGDDDGTDDVADGATDGGADVGTDDGGDSSLRRFGP